MCKFKRLNYDATFHIFNHCMTLGENNQTLEEPNAFLGEQTDPQNEKEW